VKRIIRLRRTTAFAPQPDDAGFGLIEIVVSMFLLAIIAIAFIPVLIQSLRTTARNAVIAAATQVVSSNIEDARSRGPLCSNVADFANDPSLDSMTIPAGHGVSLRVFRSPRDEPEHRDDTMTCPSDPGAYPTAISFTVTVTSTTDTNTVLAKATTLIFVKAAS